jgi:hypothetical protein
VHSLYDIRNKATLAQLREKLFILWGDLEEQKNAFTYLNYDGTANSSGFPTNVSNDSPALLELRTSTLNNNTPPGNQQVAFPNQGRLGTKNSTNTPFLPSSKPFECCILEYGVAVADMSDIFESYIPMRRMFGTTII